MKNNGFKTITRVLGGHRVKVIVPPKRSIEEREGMQKRLEEKLRKVAERQRNKGIHPSTSD